ncbi:NYN domain-containing protein [Candidatus Gracilibacteria bacterium]|nr:NYN domain-containing protein [Candidatus Gracilibacteria bacterium]
MIAESARNNYAFIDGQNLYMATAKRDTDPWRVDLARFRVYLARKYGVTKAFYFLGYLDETQNKLYENIQSAGFILLFREHTSLMLGNKKGNVDSDIILQIMKKMYYKEPFENVVLVSGDGDYKQLVDFLIEEKRLEKVLFPDGHRASSLYKKLGAPCFAALDEPGTRRKIEMKKAP